MKKLFRFLAFFLLGGILLGLAGYFALALYYRGNFPVNTWINGIYCTGKSVEQVNGELVNSQEPAKLSVVDADGVSWEIDQDEAGIRPDFTSELNSYLRRNASAGWLENLHKTVTAELTAGWYAVEEEKFRDYFEKLPFVAEEREKEYGVSVCRSEEGFILQDGNLARLGLEKAYAYLKECLEKGQTNVNLSQGGCYDDLPDREADKKQRELWAGICAFQEQCSGMVFDMGAEQIAFTPEIAGGFLECGPGDGLPVLDERGNVTVGEEKVREWVEALAMQYDTCGTERVFDATRGEKVTVKYVTYGTKLDVEAETAYLLETLRGMSPPGEMPHVPAYVQQGYVRGLDDIGGTYIEIDMTEQKMYYYEDGELILDTDVVTGNTGRRMGTPQGINFVYAKERNRTLRGADYASFVKYWMPVKGNVGIHDASWRARFGGQIYKTNGSHGCINTPSDVMSQLYEMAEVGTPVIMFY